MANKSVFQSPFLHLTISLILMSTITGIGIVLSWVLPQAWLAFLAGTSIFILLALLLARFVRGLSSLEMPLLVLVCVVSGMMLNQLATGQFQIIIAFTLCAINYVVLLGITWLVRLQLQRFNIVLALLAICFSFVGGMLVFIEGSPLIQSVWLLAAIVCLDLLLYVLLESISKTQKQMVYPAFSGVVLINIALFMNMLLILSAWGIAKTMY